MPTHQSLSGTSDDDLLQRMVKTHPERYDDAYWKFFDAHVAPQLPPRPIYVHTPSYVTAFDVERVDGPPGATIGVAVHLENNSAFWWDSGYEYHPVRASYRWLSPSGTHKVKGACRTCPW